MHFKQLSIHRKGIIFGVLAAMLWGLDGILMGNSMNSSAFAEFSLIVVALLSAGLHDGFAGIWVFIYNLINKNLQKYIPTITSNKFLFVAAIMGGPIGITANFIGIRLAGVYAIVIASCYPVISALIETIILKKKIRLQLRFGIILVVLGTVFISYVPPQNLSSTDFFFGIGCGFVAAIGWAIEGVITTLYLKEDTIESIVLGIREIISFVVILAIIPFVIKSGEIMLLPKLLGSKIMIGLLIIALIGAISFIAWYKSMHYTGITCAMGLNATYSLWAVVFAYFINGTELSVYSFLGALILFLGALFVILGSGHSEDI